MSAQPQLGLEIEIGPKKQKTVVCLGMEFPNDEARRAYFMELLRKRLKDPEFRKIDGFPIGEDEDILAISDPPYYTACPNPWIADFIREWQVQNRSQRGERTREPFAVDVSEGKNDPIYNAHTYHTKVPYRAIMRYILHYTEPGDVVFDGFCGTGMTGVAAQMCGDRDALVSLGYQVRADGTILRENTDENGRKTWVAFSTLGARRVILSDLSPAAAFIARNYNVPADVKTFEILAKRVLEEALQECGWVYETKHPDGRAGKINYMVWSDVFICPECAGEVVFWEAALDKVAGSVREEFSCPHCGAVLTKQTLDKAWITKNDPAIGATSRRAKQIPVLINYTVGGKRVDKTPDPFDLELIKRIEAEKVQDWFPTDEMMHVEPGKPWGDEWRPGRAFTNVHHLLFERSNMALASLYKRIMQEKEEVRSLLLLCFTAVLHNSGRMYRWRENGKGGTISGTYYLSSTPQENNVYDQFRSKLSYIAKALCVGGTGNAVVGVESLSDVTADGSTVDYIFLDPPFGSNLAYSELNFVWESWLKVWTNKVPEAIENKTQGKGVAEYRHLMTSCFEEAYRVLKPGRWMTVEFSNTKASVWNAIQTALTDAGFIVANVSALDKKQGSFKAITTPTAVKQDLVISAYKPDGSFEESLQREAEVEEGVWEFVGAHLERLPVIKQQGPFLQLVPERDPRILFDQMVAFYVRKGYRVPISSSRFQVGLSQRFDERDGMYFLPEQTAEYDCKRKNSQLMTQTSLFVSDESSAIQWLGGLLKGKPQKFSEINPQFMKQLSGWSKSEIQLDLRELLSQNFLCYEGMGPVPEPIHAYLSTNWREMRNLSKEDPALVDKAKDRWYVPDPNRAGDLERLRERTLLREFEEYRKTNKRLRVFRLEAIRAGFKKAWQERDYATIMNVAEKIPSDVLEENSKLLMWYDQAVTRTGHTKGR